MKNFSENRFFSKRKTLFAFIIIIILFYLLFLQSDCFILIPNYANFPDFYEVQNFFL